MSTESKIKKLTAQLYPRGRAFRIPRNGVKEELIHSMSQSEKRAYEDALSILNVILPDNMNFTADDATRWEERLGLITNDSVSLEDRKAVIIRKMNHPGKIPARQNWLYLEQQLQAAGFDVYVYENNFGGVTLSPTDIIGSGLSGISIHGLSAHGEGVHGNVNTGSVYQNCVANYINEILDYWFDVGDNLRNTFYISGPYIDTFADVPLERKEEFRQLILRIKPVQTIAFLFVNFT